MVTTHMHARIKVEGQMVQNTDWKQTGERADGVTDMTDRIIFPFSLTWSVTS